jgi:hypothetical protein
MRKIFDRGPLYCNFARLACTRLLFTHTWSHLACLLYMFVQWRRKDWSMSRLHRVFITLCCKTLYIPETFKSGYKDVACLNDVTLVLSAEWNELIYLPDLAINYASPISLSLYAPGPDLDTAVKYLVKLRACYKVITNLNHHQSTWRFLQVCENCEVFIPIGCVLLFHLLWFCR